MTDPFEEDEYVSIPFVLTEAEGGEYDNEAFSAGWNLAILDARLALAVTSDLLTPPVLMRTKWKPQADLIAMSHSLLIKEIPSAREGYSFFIFGTADFFESEES